MAVNSEHYRLLITVIKYLDLTVSTACMGTPDGCYVRTCMRRLRWDLWLTLTTYSYNSYCHSCYSHASVEAICTNYDN